MIEINNKTKNKIDLKAIEKITADFLKYYKIKNQEVSIAFVGDEEIKKLNKKYRKIDKTTDVLSFAGNDDYLGEVIINYSQIKRQAKKFSKNTEEELEFILVHGLLHLLGYDDETEKEAREMEEMGEKFVSKISKL